MSSDPYPFYCVEHNYAGHQPCPQCISPIELERSGFKHSPPRLQAQLNMKEFDPTKERHRAILIIKAVDPGCTLEVQIEDCVTGEVTRLTTTEDPVTDREWISTAVMHAFRKAFERAMREHTR